MWGQAGVTQYWQLYLPLSGLSPYRWIQGLLSPGTISRAGVCISLVSTSRAPSLGLWDTREEKVGQTRQSKEAEQVQMKVTFLSAQDSEGVEALVSVASSHSVP